MSDWTLHPRGRQVVSGCLLVVLIIVAYVPAMRGGFVWDDDQYVTNNPLLTAPDGLWRIWFTAHRQSQYFPLVFTTFRFEYELWGLNPLGYHLVNICFHAMNALLVWRLLRRLAVPGSWLAAAIFALHPVQVESVAWITELKNLESLFFYLLAVLAWLRFVERTLSNRWVWYALALLSACLALFAKTTACTLPAALFLVSWYRRIPMDRRLGLALLPFVAAGIAMGCLSIWWEGHLGNRGAEVVQSLNWLQRALLAGHALWFYIGKLVWPSHLCFSYGRWNIDPKDPLQYLSLAAALAIAFLFWRKRDQLPRGVLAAVIFFVAALSPMIGFIPNYTWLFSYVADHYEYPATIGLIALFSAAVTAWFAASWKLPARVMAALPLVAVLCVLTWRQAAVYTDAKSLWTDTLSKNPRSWLAHNNLGELLSEQGDYAGAASHFQEVIQLNPDYAEARNNLGLALAHLGNQEGAVNEYRAAVQMDPGLFGAWMNMGNTLEQLGRTNEAVTCYRQAANLQPKQLEPLRRLIQTLLVLDRAAEAEDPCRQALKLAPDEPRLHLWLAIAIQAQGNRAEEAKTEFEKSLQLQTLHKERAQR